MCEVIAGAGGCVAGDVDGLAAVSGPVALQAVRLVLPEGALRHISFSVYGLQGTEGKQRRRKLWMLLFFLLVSALRCSVVDHHRGDFKKKADFAGLIKVIV